MRRGVSLLAAVFLWGCARSDCVRADDALVAASHRLVEDTPSVGDGDSSADARRKLLVMADIIDEQQSSIAALSFDDQVVAEAMRDYAEGLARMSETVRQTASVTATLTDSAASLEVARAELDRSLDALESACAGARPTCAISWGTAPKGSTRSVLSTVMKRVRAVQTHDAGAIRARADALRQIQRVQELLLQTADATTVVVHVTEELDHQQTTTTDVLTRLRDHCTSRRTGVD